MCVCMYVGMGEGYSPLRPDRISRSSPRHLAWCLCRPMYVYVCYMLHVYVMYVCMYVCMWGWGKGIAPYGLTV